jgi:hypothetical protein
VALAPSEGFEPSTLRVRCNRSLRHRRTRLAGNLRCCPCPWGRALRLAGFEPVRRRGALPRSNSHLHHRRARASRADVEGAGERSIPAITVRYAEPFSRSARSPRRTDPRGADSTARSNGGGIRTRIRHCCEVSEIFTTSVRSLSRRSEKPRGRGSPGGTVESRWPEGLRWGRSNETHHHPEL